MPASPAEMVSTRRREILRQQMRKLTEEESWPQPLSSAHVRTGYLVAYFTNTHTHSDKCSIFKIYLYCGPHTVNRGKKCIFKIILNFILRF